MSRFRVMAGDEGFGHGQEAHPKTRWASQGQEGVYFSFMPDPCNGNESHLLEQHWSLALGHQNKRLVLLQLDICLL